MLKLDPAARPTMNEVYLEIDPTMPPPPAVPADVSTPPQLHPLASHSLGYAAHIDVGIGGDGLILLGRENPEALELLQLRDRVFQQVWEKPCPPGVGCEDRKYIVGECITTRDYDRDPTRCWDLRMQRLHEHETGQGLVLVSCLAPHVMVYREEIGEDSYQLVLRGCEMPPLRPPAGSPWREGLSVCHHAGTGWYAVCEWFYRSLDIFDAAGHHQHHVSLQYEPGHTNAICCTESHLIVCEVTTTVLHIHTWSGQEVRTVDLEQVCGVSWLECVKSVAVCDGGRTLIVAVGGVGQVLSLHALTISD